MEAVWSPRAVKKNRTSAIQKISRSVRSVYTHYYYVDGLLFCWYAFMSTQLVSQTAELSQLIVHILDTLRFCALLGKALDNVRCLS